jgi:hypothetical protein
MSANRALPLNEPQERHITVILASLERLLAELRERLERPPRDLPLVRYEDPISADEAGQLLPVVANAESRLRRVAADLGLEARIQPARRAFIAGLELSRNHLHECRADGGLGSYGAVATATADYLEREIPKLDETVQLLLRRLQHRNRPSP